MQSGFLYNDSLLTARLKMLRNLAEGDDPLIFVIGEKGSGKTTLLNSILSSMTNRWRICYMRFESGKGDHQVKTVGNLNGCPGILLGTGRPPMLLFDDAHNINIEGMRYLLRHAMNDRNQRKFRGIILFCDPSLNGFVKKLSESVPSRSVINTIHINPLTFEQTRNFLRQLSRSWDPAGKKCFSSSQAEKIFAAAKGLPGKIHDEAKRVAMSRPVRQKNSLLKKLAGRFV